MTKTPFLHELPEFAEVIQSVSQQRKIANQLVEKDYWLMHVLWGLQNCGLTYELKGGTSLSKGWNIIHRFSEDIDIKIFPPEDLKVYFGRNHSKPKHRKSREEHFHWLLGVLNIPGTIYVNRDLSFDDHDIRSVGYRIGYTSLYNSFLGVKTDILLEVGFDTTTPNEHQDISSWVYDLVKEAGLKVQDNRAKEVPCYLPEYTFVEKLSAISKKYRQETGGKSVQNFTRHYYDIYQLLQQERIITFIGTEEYFIHKSARFNKDDEMNISDNPAFTLSNTEIRERYSERFANSSGLYFHEQPSIEAILNKINMHIHKL